MLIETHVHLDDTRYEVDRDAVMERARQAGVGALVTIGTGLDDSAWACDFAAAHADVYAVVGIHPEMSGGFNEADLVRWRELVKRPKVVAVGEVGLDYHSEGFDAAHQEKVMQQMLALAREARLPLVLHMRDAAADTLRVLRDEQAGQYGGVFHCFAADLEAAQTGLAMGFHIGVGGVLTFPNAKALREVIRQVPLDRLVLETDGPWLAPQGHRGQRNEPAYLTEICAKLAEVKGVTVVEIEQATTANAKRLFKIQ